MTNGLIVALFAGAGVLLPLIASTVRSDFRADERALLDLEHRLDVLEEATEVDPLEEEFRALESAVRERDGRP